MRLCAGIGIEHEDLAVREARWERAWGLVNTLRRPDLYPVLPPYAPLPAPV